MTQKAQKSTKFLKEIKYQKNKQLKINDVHFLIHLTDVIEK